jgi:hypothetical protein
MKAEEFDKASIEELQALANRCFKAAQSPLEEVEMRGFYAEPSPRILDDAAKLRLLLEAQFYLTAVARKRDEEVAKRDRTLEIWVIILIGIEILLSIGGIWIGIHEANGQGRVLSNIESSTRDSAAAMSAAKASLQILANSQTKSLDHLKQMDDSLRSSLKTTGTMASTTRNQLQILREEQASRVAQLAKRPKLALYVGDVPVNGLPVSFKPRTVSDTSISFDFRLVNEGDARATRPLLRVIVVSKDVTLDSTIPVQRPVEPPDSPSHVFLLQLDNVRPKVSVPMTITFNYPTGTKKFSVGFNVDADEIDAATFLGTVDINPYHLDIR